MFDQHHRQAARNLRCSVARSVVNDDDFHFAEQTAMLLDCSDGPTQDDSPSGLAGLCDLEPVIGGKALKAVDVLRVGA